MDKPALQSKIILTTVIYTIHALQNIFELTFYDNVHPKPNLIPFEDARQENTMIRKVFPPIIFGLGWLIRLFNISGKAKPNYSELIITNLQNR